MTKIFNYTQLDDNLTIGGQPMINQFIELEDIGFDKVIQIKVKEADYILQDEAYHVEQHNMEYASMEMSYANPTVENVQRFFNLLDNSKNKKLFVHCTAGFCTSGMVVMYKMLRDKISYEDARTKYTIGNWQPNDLWLNLIDEVKAVGI